MSAIPLAIGFLLAIASGLAYGFAFGFLVAKRRYVRPVSDNLVIFRRVR